VAGLLLAALIAGCGTNVQGTGRLKVATDIVPLADFCRRVGGDMVEVEVLVPPGATPHAYELTTGQMRFLTQADVLVTNGLGLTPWSEEVLGKVDNPELLTVVAGDAVPTQGLIAVDGDGAGADEGAENGPFDPHVWLDPELAIYMVTAVRDAFISVDPVNSDYYRDNAAEYSGELLELDAEIAEEVAAFSNREFVAFHSSWTYFARRYGLQQVGVIEEQPGKEPSAGEIAALVDLIMTSGVKVVFAEPQFSPRAAQAIAEESGGEVAVRMLDPLGDPNDPESDGYIKVMRKNVAVMGEVLR
jgi:zinc transport system substrate-binding protein